MERLWDKYIPPRCTSTVPFFAFGGAGPGPMCALDSALNLGMILLEMSTQVVAWTTQIPSLWPEVGHNLMKYPVGHPVNMLAVQIDLQSFCGVSDNDRHDMKKSPRIVVRSTKRKCEGNSSFAGGKASESQSRSPWNSVELIAYQNCSRSSPPEDDRETSFAPQKMMQGLDAVRIWIRGTEAVR
jgi:hypothetical protein